MVKALTFWCCFLSALLMLNPKAQAQVEQTEPLPAGLAFGLANAPESDQLVYERWLDWFDNSPELLGQTTYRNEPLLAGEQLNVVIRYRTGIDLDVGSKVTVLVPWSSGIRLQSQEADRPNYLVLRSTFDAGAVVASQAPGVVPFSHWYAGGNLLAFEVIDMPIPEGTELEFSIANLQLPGQAGGFYLPVAFSLPGEDILMSGAPIELTIRPNRTEQVELLGPSRIGRNENTELEVRLLDRFGNLSEDRAPTLDLLLNGSFERRVDLQGAVTEIPDLRFSEPGANFAEVRTGGGGLRSQSNPIFVQSGNKQIRWFDISPSDSVSLLRSSLRQGGTLYEANIDARSFRVALPFVPTDDRSFDFKSIRLAQVVSGDSQFEWFTNRLYRQGYRVGVAGGSFSPVGPSGLSPRRGLTAALSRDASALAQGATYATTGARIVVQMTVNGGEAGSRVRANKERRISGWVQGTGPIDRVELIRNGKVISTQSLAADPESNVIKLSMFSSSEPIRGQRDLPRNGREWIGFLRTPGTNLSLAGTPGFRNSERQAAAQNGNNRVDFITWTHGGWSSLFASFDETGADDDVLEVSFRQVAEDRDIFPELRDPASIPATRQMIPLFDLDQGPVIRRLSHSGYDDLLRIERVNPQSPSYVEFSFSDASPFAEEDYYYVKIYQLDDHVAWTSPVFVGGFDPG